jgi:hypothetical protein
MPGSQTSPGQRGACDGAARRVAFRHLNNVGTRNIKSIAAQWLACVLLCRRFADTLAGACARLEANADRYSFIVMDFHHLLLAGLPGALKYLWLGFIPLPPTYWPALLLILLSYGVLTHLTKTWFVRRFGLD